MSMMVTERHVVVDGAQVAGAVVTDTGAEVRLRIHIAGGHVPPKARREIVDKTFRLPIFDRPRPLRATVPLGDPEVIVELSRHLQRVHARAAGSTCLIEGIVITEDCR